MLLAYLVGLVSGAALPLQTSVNNRLRERVTAPLIACFVNFLGGVLTFALFSIVTGAGLLPHLSGPEPLWMWLGGPCGVILISGNILLLPRLGSVQTVILCVFGQVMTGLLVDGFGWLGSEEIPFTVPRFIGAVCVILGVFLNAAEGHRQRRSGNPPSSSEGETAAAQRSGSTPLLWLYRAYGILAGVACACQVAVNAELAEALQSDFKAGFYSFSGGVLCGGTLLLIFLLLRGRPAPDRSVPLRPWMLTGGVLGFVCVASNIYLAAVLGTGMAVVVSLIGQILGGALIDRIGLLGIERQSLTARKWLGLLLMVLGAALIRML